MNKLTRLRPSPAMVVACIALIVALGGSAYALKKNSVGTKQLKKGAVTTKKIKNGAVTNAKLGSGAVTSAKLPGCPSGTTLIRNDCWETTAHPADNLYDASKDCADRGGRVPMAGELLGVRDEPGIDLGSNGSMTANWAAELVHNEASTIDDTGANSLNLPANTTDRPYRCIISRIR